MGLSRSSRRRNQRHSLVLDGVFGLGQPRPFTFSVPASLVLDSPFPGTNEALEGQSPFANALGQPPFVLLNVLPRFRSNNSTDSQAKTCSKVKNKRFVIDSHQRRRAKGQRDHMLRYLSGKNAQTVSVFVAEYAPTPSRTPST